MVRQFRLRIGLDVGMVTNGPMNGPALFSSRSVSVKDIQQVTHLYRCSSFDRSSEPHHVSIPNPSYPTRTTPARPHLPGKPNSRSTPQTLLADASRRALGRESRGKSFSNDPRPGARRVLRCDYYIMHRLTDVNFDVLVLVFLLRYIAR